MRSTLSALALILASQASAQSLPYSGSGSSSGSLWSVSNFGIGHAGAWSGYSDTDSTLLVVQNGNAPVLELQSSGSTGTAALTISTAGTNAAGIAVNNQASVSTLPGIRVESSCLLGSMCMAGEFRALGGVSISASAGREGVNATGSMVGVRADTNGSSGTALIASNTSSATNPSGYAIYATSANGVVARLEGQTAGKSALSTQSFNSSPSIQSTNTNGGVAIKANSTSESAVFAESSLWAGVFAISSSTVAAANYGENTSGAAFGVAGRGRAAGTGVYGDVIDATTGYAGYFNGRVHVNGLLSKTAGTFRIDHPQDPANLYLVHSFVESPEMKNIYDGTVTLDPSGEATVTLPRYFESLNRDYRYQLTPIGRAATLFIKREISGGSFEISGGFAGQKVSWQVTGVRQDAWARANPLTVEEPKRGSAIGKYLNPEVFGRGMGFAENPPPMVTKP